MKFKIYNDEYAIPVKNYLENHPHYTIWHSQSWFNNRLTSKKITKIIAVTIEETNTVIAAGVIQVVNKSRFFKYGYIQAGFLYDFIDDSVMNEILKGLKKCADSEKLMYIEIDSIEKYSDDYTNILKNINEYSLINIKPIIPQFTTMINIKQTEDEILEQMKPKGRYNIKIASKKGVTIRASQSESDIRAFYTMLLETTLRDGFKPNDFNYYKSFVETIDGCVLLIAEHEGEIIAGGIFTYTGKQALYYYGASSNNKRNCMAPYLVQWEAIRDGIKNGCEYYDFMGIQDSDKTDDPLSGVTDFKLKFGGSIVQFNNSIRIITNEIKYVVFRSLFGIKNNISNLYSFFHKIR